MTTGPKTSQSPIKNPLRGRLLPSSEMGVETTGCQYLHVFAGLFVETVHPAFSTSDLDVKRRRHTTLKRLDFVRAYTEYYWSKANTIASMVRSSSACSVCISQSPFNCCCGLLEHPCELLPLQCVA